MLGSVDAVPRRFWKDSPPGKGRSKGLSVSSQDSTAEYNIVHGLPQSRSLSVSRQN